MPLVERRMMETVFAMDYSDVNRYAHRIKILLEDAVNARVEFSTGDSLTMDLRSRHAGADDGDCTYPGACINLPSGEGFIAPYEAVGEEQNTFGVSRTKGVLPLSVENEILGCVVNKNRIGEIKGPERLVSKMKAYFDQAANRRNIAELGIGCNPQAKVSGNIIEDEKAGVHIAYGTSHHLGGKITSDLHQDIIFAKGCPVTADSVIFSFEEAEPMELVKDAQVQYHLLK
jgi:leucyl aminopeptidase (aminopeptidase T)